MGARGVAWVALCACACSGAAEFRSWEDGTGQRRLSNLPPSQVGVDGGLREARHPLSIAAQHAALRARLAARDAELARRDEAAAPPEIGRAHV